MKKYVVEFLGTFFLTLTAAFSANPLAVGFMFIALFILGHAISGAYFNPAVVAGGLLRKTLPLRQGLYYICAQCLGAALACTWFYLCYQDVFMPILPCANIYMSALFELLMTCLFALVIYKASSISSQEWATPYTSFAAGLTLSGAAFCGAVCNPAIAGMAVVVSIASGFGEEYMTPILLVQVFFALLGGMLAGRTSNSFVTTK